MALLFKIIFILSLQSFEKISNIPNEFQNHLKILKISDLIWSIMLIQNVDDWAGGNKNDVTHICT